MYKEKLKILDSYLKSGLTNILIEDMPKEIFEDEKIEKISIDDVDFYLLPFLKPFHLKHQDSHRTLRHFRQEM